MAIQGFGGYCCTCDGCTRTATPGWTELEAKTNAASEGFKSATLTDASGGTHEMLLCPDCLATIKSL